MLLIIDDDPVYCELIRDLVVAEGITSATDIRIANQGKTAVEAVEAVIPKIPSTVILDLMLPFSAEVTTSPPPAPENLTDAYPGLQVLEELLDRNVPISHFLVITAVPDVARGDDQTCWGRLMEFGISRTQILEKPVRAEVMALAIKRCFSAADPR